MLCKQTRTDLLCPCHQSSNRTPVFTRYFVQNRRWRLTQNGKRTDSPPVRCRARADNFWQAHLGADVIVAAPYIRWPSIRVTGRHCGEEKPQGARSGPKWTDFCITFLSWVLITNTEFFYHVLLSGTQRLGVYFTVECSQPEPDLSNSFWIILL